MKIAYKAPYWPPEGPTTHAPNGIVSYLGGLVPAVQALGHEVFVVTANVAGPTDGCQVFRVERTGANGPFGRLWSRALNRWDRSYATYRAGAGPMSAAFKTLVEREGIDIIEMEETYGWCRKVISDVPVPVVVRMHGPYFINGQFDRPVVDVHNASRNKLEGLGLRSAGAITAPSQHLLDIASDYFGLSDINRAAIPNPVPPANEAAKWSIETCSRNDILFVGWANWRKGGDLVIRVFDRLVRKNKDLTLHFVGPNSSFQDEKGNQYSLEEYVSTAMSPEARERVRFYGRLPSNKIEPLRRRCFLTLVFSRYETFGNVCMEALAQGSPLVATNTGGIPEIVRHDENGLLAEPDDLDDLTAKVQLLLDRPDLAARLGQAGWEDSRTRFNPVTLASQTVAFYQSVLDHRQAPIGKTG